MHTMGLHRTEGLDLNLGPWHSTRHSTRHSTLDTALGAQQHGADTAGGRKGSHSLGGQGRPQTVTQALDLRVRHAQGEHLRESSLFEKERRLRAGPVLQIPSSRMHRPRVDLSPFSSSSSRRISLATY